jgi:hypothetical protein
MYIRGGQPWLDGRDSSGKEFAWTAAFRTGDKAAMNNPPARRVSGSPRMRALEICELGLRHRLHYRDAVRVALKRLEADVRSAEIQDVLPDIRKEVSDEAIPNAKPGLYAVQ